MEQETKKNVIKIVIAVVLAIVLFAGGCCLGLFVEQPKHAAFKGAKNFILLIGDGMGKNHIEAAKSYYGLDSLNMESPDAFVGEVTTRSKDDVVTDSAASGTAMSTGIKVNNKNIATLNGERIENMAEFCQRIGIECGIIATEVITGATPAAFSGHDISRADTESIFKSQIISGVDFFLCAGASELSPYLGELTTHNYFTYYNQTNLEKAINNKVGRKIFAAFETVDNYGTDVEETPSLAQAVTYGLDFLSNRGRFFLMVEGSHIDKQSHDNDMEGMVKELRAFDEAVKVALDWAKQDGETLVIVVADHETGGIVLPTDGQKPTDDCFTTDDHTGQNVKYFAYYFGKNALKNYAIIDNTFISTLIRENLQNYKSKA